MAGKCRLGVESGLHGKRTQESNLVLASRLLLPLHQVADLECQVAGTRQGAASATSTVTKWDGRNVVGAGDDGDDVVAVISFCGCAV